MFLRTLIIILGLVALIGCSSNPNYYDASCNPGDPICLGLAITKSINNNSSANKCSQMSGERKKACEEKVESLKKHIKNATIK